MTKATFFASPALLLAAGLAGAALTAHAEPTAGLYVSSALGFNDLQTQTITGVGAPFGPQPGGNVKSDNGGVGLLALGYSFGNGLRFELEGGYRRNHLNRATAGALKEAGATGDQNKTSVFANTLYDFPKLSSVTPYVGVGFGHVRTKWSDLYISQGNELVHFNNTAGSNAYQAIIGARVLENFVPGLSLTVEYRYLSARGITQTGAVERSRFGRFPITATLDRTRDQSVLIGLNYRFKD